MPRLSPTTTGGRILKWHASPGEKTVNYQLIVELAVTKLASQDDGDKVTKVDIEILEELSIVHIFAFEGQAVQEGTPLAIMSENLLSRDSSLSIVNEMQKDLGEQPNLYEIPLGNKYQLAIWQAYVKD